MSTSSQMNHNTDNEPIIALNPEAISGGGIDYDSMKVKELRVICRNRGIGTYGSKEDIVQRLVANDNGSSYTRKYTKKKKDD